MTTREQLIEKALSDLQAIGDPMKILSRTVRPAFVAPPGQTLVWGDWSAIEARVLPWLAHSRGANKVLDVFKGNDSSPDLPDIYVIEYCHLSGEDPAAVWARYRDKDPAAKKGRQQGKVSVLSLGFGGAEGALIRMASNYGVYYDTLTAAGVVRVWREANPWARSYWNQLWEAALEAYANPDTIFEAGRNAYLYDRSYLGGTLFAAQPDGKLLAYPKLQWRKSEIEDKATGKIVEKKTLSCRKAYGWKGLWYGTFAENNTQSTAGGLLRHKLKELRPQRIVVGHTHDEIITVAPENEAGVFSARLHETMVTNPAWMPGCPLAAETTSHWYYTKALD